MNMLRMNLIFAFRTLFKTRIFAICVVVSIALGIGANSAIFSLFDAVLFQKLPVLEPERLVNLRAPGPHLGGYSYDIQGADEEVFSYPMFRDLEKSQTVFAGIAAHVKFDANVAARDSAAKGVGLLVSGSYFPTLGIQPALGRLLSPADDKLIGEPHAVVLSYAYWKNRFGKDPGMLNQTMIINGRMMTIVGVAQEGFRGTTVGLEPQVFIPITMMEAITRTSMVFNNRGYDWAYLFARLKPDVTSEQARAAINTQYRAIISGIETPLLKNENELAQFKSKQLFLTEGAHGQSMADDIARTPFSILLCLTGLVLLIACINVANLLLARGTAKAGEIALRMSIGASRRRIVAQLLTESCLLALVAGAISLQVAQVVLDLLASLVPLHSLGLGMQFTISKSTLLFTAVLTLITGLLFGLFPALHCTRPDLSLALKGQNQTTGATSTIRFRRLLSVAQLGISFALLATAGLFLKSLHETSYEDLGMKVDNIVVFGVSPSMNGYTHQQSVQFLDRLKEELTAIPGTDAVAESSMRLLNYYNSGGNVLVEGYDSSSATHYFSHSLEGLKNNSGTHYYARYNWISPDYFRTLGIPMVAGRDFTSSDSAASPRVAIVNEAFAGLFNLGKDIIGKRMGFEGGPLDAEIVGIVKNSKYWAVRAEDEPVFYFPHKQAQIDSLTFYVRGLSDPGQLFPAIRRVMTRLDPKLPVENLCTMPEQVRNNTFVDRMIGILSAAFACLATLMAAVGLYGILAYTVVQRTREIGLRIAVGASAPQVCALAFRQVGWITISGGVIGLALALAVGRLAESLLYYINGSDAVVLCTSAVVLGSIALAAGFIPARRASHLDPVKALRWE